MLSNKNDTTLYVTCYLTKLNNLTRKGACQKLLSGSFPLLGGGLPPHSAKFFLAQWLSVKGMGRYPPFPLMKKSAKKHANFSPI